MTSSEYLKTERAAEYKSEFRAGEMLPMSGASRPHNLIVASLVRLLMEAVSDRPYEVYASSMRVKVTTSFYTYPDVVVTCEKPEFEDDVLDTLLNPTVLIEVLSESTESYDRGRKSGHYRQLASLQEYLIVSQNEPRVEHYARQGGDHWLLSDAAGPEGRIELASLGATIRLADVYARIGFSA
ncbi:MAG: Uma2 family endonuclease [Planctomycetota bacterium]